MTAPLIGVGIPVWRGAAFVAETLESVLNQRGVRFKLFVSIDGADADSERACLPFASDPRVRIVVQPRRLGWVKNTAAVLAGVEQAEFVCVQPHDDWVETEYLATLLDTARNHPSAAVVFSDLSMFGTQKGVCTQESVVGTPVERQVSLLTRHFNAISYRGLNRTSALKAVPPLSGNHRGDFACDTVWMARLARAGDLVRVPRVLYHKRYLPNSAHAEWATWHRWQKGATWVHHCLDMLAEALTVAASIEERRLLIDAARGRLWLTHTYLGPYAAQIRALSRISRWGMRVAFEAGAAMRSDIGPLGPIFRRPGAAELLA
jgi:glycosyltransferase involved in cell wall biosynthesis